MRRLLSSLLLALCLAVAQHGALLHALRHDLADAGLVTEDESPHPAGVVCLSCLAFAHMTGVSAGSPAMTPLLSLSFERASDPGFASRPAESPPACSRGPPRVG